MGTVSIIICAAIVALQNAPKSQPNICVRKLWQHADDCGDYEDRIVSDAYTQMKTMAHPCLDKMR